MRANRVLMKTVLFLALIALAFSQTETALPTADPTPGFSFTPTATPPARSPTPTASPAAPSITSSITPSPSSAVSPSPSPSVVPPSITSSPSVAPASPSPSVTPPVASASATPGVAKSPSPSPSVTPKVAKSPAPQSPQTPGSSDLLTPGSPESSGKTTDGSTMYHYADFSSVINLSKFDSDYFNANFTTFGSGSYFEIFSSLDSSESSVLSPLVSLFLLALSVLAFFL